MAENLVPRGLLAVVGFACGASAFFFGFYGTTVWEPIVLGALAVLLGVFIAHPSVPRGAAAVAVAGLVGLWFWSLLSSSWAEAADHAVTDANRWLLYAVVLAALLMLRDVWSSRQLLIGAVTAGVLAMAVYIDARLLLGDGSSLFVGNRLNGPLDYINAEATYLLIGLWPLIALAERLRSPWLQGLAIFAAVQLLSLALLTQSRGAVLALAVSATVLLIVVPGRLTRAWALAVALAGVAFALPQLRDVIDAGANSAPSDSALRSVAAASLFGGAIVGAAWGAARAIVAAMDRPEHNGGDWLRFAPIAGMVVIALAGAAVASVPPGKRVDQIQTQYDNFTQLHSTGGGGDRLVSGGGHRYDYWRIAFDQFKDHPIEGVGAGNYDRTYYLERRTTEDVSQAHSIELQALGETGLVGGAALAVFVVPVLLGFGRVARSREPEQEFTAVAAGGMFLIWMVHTSVDWMHLIPGLTGCVLCAAAALLPTSRPLPARRLVVFGVAMAVLVLLAAYPVARQLRALDLHSDAQAELASDPAAALADARDSLDLQRSAQAAYSEAAAYARLGLYEPARATLIRTARAEPHNFVVWGLLGDLAIRHGDRRLAKAAYGRAAALNPRDPTLKTLAK